MSLWAAIAGASNQYLKEHDASQEDFRWKRKQEFLAELQEEMDLRKEQRDVIGTVQDPQNRQIIEMLRSGDQRVIDMPKAMQQQLFASRNREKDEIKSLRDKAKFDQEMKEKEYDLDVIRTNAYAEGIRKSGAGGGAPAQLKPSDLRAYQANLQKIMGSLMGQDANNKSTGVDPEYRYLYDQAVRSLFDQDLGSFKAYETTLMNAALMSPEERQRFIEEARKKRINAAFGFNQ